MRSFPRIVAAGLGIFMVVFGLWAFFGPQSFYDQIATFGTYNVHLLHDVGAFQVGFGVTVLLALIRTDALAVVLAGGAVGTVMHAIAHVVDKDLGGPKTKLEPVELSVLAVIVVVAAVMALRRKA